VSRSRRPPLHGTEPQKQIPGCDGDGARCADIDMDASQSDAPHERDLPSTTPSSSPSASEHGALGSDERFDLAMRAVRDWEH
jgi:hypothetical protein